MYTLSFLEDETTYPSRRAAIDAAKQITDGTHHEARISDEKQIESLVYQRGEMIYYEYDTRRSAQARREAR